MKTFVIDVSKCAGCYCCQLACKDENCDNDWMPYAKPQPKMGQFWGKLNEYVRGQVPQVKMSYVFVPCQHCEKAPCIAACSPGAIYTRKDGLVIIDPKKCTGCRDCVKACPYSAIYFNETLKLAQKCTGCAHILDRGWPIKEPRCADACPHSAIKFGEDSELKELIAKSENLHPEYGTKPRVHYTGLPKRFIAGTVYDPDTKEVIIGAKCMLTGKGIANLTQETDEFGDFWFDGLAADDFALTISNNGKTKKIEVSAKEKDIGLGDIPLA
jgi:tetrathionate reductase subunit B